MTKTNRALLPGLLGAAALLAASLAHAQYAWIDDKGVRHYSDRPPPATVPAAKVLKAPGKRMEDVAADAQAAEPAAKADASPTLADREADYRKRMQARAKEEEKAAKEAALAREKAKSCDNARHYKAMLDSGIRVVDTGADGERRYLGEDERAKRAAEANATIAADCR